jgi:hypothetical protein
MPCLNQELSVFRDQPFDPAYFMVGKPKVLGKRNWLQPKLGDVPIPFHVDVHWFTTVRTEEHEAVGTNRENGRHPTSSRQYTRLPLTPSPSPSLSIL